ncbi:zinc finger protein 852-like [Brachyistius frenatus]|uniref:zinc finger protein 852-like n=1 Tax=Brachyistius frenatus TaxID=100188 RepID=UPI0037E82403
MSKLEMLRLLINQRLTAAAEEIFGVFGRTIAEYEEEISRSRLEIDRQRRLLELRRTPRICLQVDGAAVSEQPEWSAGLELDEEQLPHIKEEEEEEEEEEEDLWSDPLQTSDQNDVCFSLFQSGIERKDDGPPKLQNRDPEDPEDPEEPQHPNDPKEPKEPDPRQGTASDLRACLNLDEDEPEASDPAAGNGRLDGVKLEAPLSEVVDSYICTICGRAFAQRGHWAKHVQVHRKYHGKVDKSYTCDICGKRLTRFDGYQKHLRIHTGEKPYSCDECGRRFSDNSNYKRHVRMHAAQKPS